MEWTSCMYLTSLFTINIAGEKWRSHRKMIAPTFHINILKSFMTTFNQNSVNVVDKMKHEMGRTFDVHDHMSGVTVDILLGEFLKTVKKMWTNLPNLLIYPIRQYFVMCQLFHSSIFKRYINKFI